MTKRRYRLSRKAIQDLREAWYYVQTLDPATADILLRRIEARLEFACIHPQNGVVRPEIHENARILVDGSFIIMYEVQENDLLIVTIVHVGRKTA